MDDLAEERTKQHRSIPSHKTEAPAWRVRPDARIFSQVQ